MLVVLTLHLNHCLPCQIVSHSYVVCHVAWLCCRLPCQIVSHSYVVSNVAWLCCRLPCKIVSHSYVVSHVAWLCCRLPCQIVSHAYVVSHVAWLGCHGHVESCLERVQIYYGSNKNYRHVNSSLYRIFSM